MLGLKKGIFLAGTSTRSPVLGLRPTRGCRWAIFGLMVLWFVLNAVVNVTTAELATGGLPLRTAMASPVFRLALLPLLTALETAVLAAGAASIYVELVILKEGALKSEIEEVFS